jgi:hypothetical protein
MIDNVMNGFHPAQAGGHFSGRRAADKWVPAFTGMG